MQVFCGDASDGVNCKVVFVYLIIIVGMFAYVKFVDDGVQKIVATENIKHFDKDTFTTTKKYKVKFEDGHYYKAFVAIIAETEEEVKSMIDSKRVRFPSQKIMDDEGSTSASVYENVTDVENIPSKSVRKPQKKLMPLSSIENYKGILTDIGGVKTLNPNENEVNRLKMENTELKKQLKELEDEMQVLQNLNYSLQNEVIDKIKDLTLPTKSPQTVTENTPIAARINGMVHLGREVWLPCQIFDSAYRRPPKKDSLFIKEIAMAIFGEKILCDSSVTGTACNRKQSTVAKPPLDPTKLMAIHDILTYRLEQRGETQDKISAVCRTINSRIAEKIQDLIRPPYKKKNKKENNNEEIENLMIIENTEESGSVVVLSVETNEN